MIGDYLDGYREFLDEHDLRALGAPPVAVQRPSYAQTRAAMPFTVQPAQPQVAAGLTRPDSSTNQRLRAALIPAGRALVLPFGSTTPSALNPGAPATRAIDMTQPPVAFAPSPASDPSGTAPPQVIDTSGATPGTAPVPGPASIPMTYAPGYVPQGQPTQQSSGGGAAGGSGTSGSPLGWLLLVVGGYWIYRNV